MARRRLVALLTRSLAVSVLLSRPFSTRAVEVDLRTAMKGFGGSYSGPETGNTTSSDTEQPGTLSQFLQKPSVKQPDPLTHGY